MIPDWPIVDPLRAAAERASVAWTDALVDEYLSVAAQQVPDQLLVVDGATQLTYADTDRRVAATAASLLDLGVGRGEVVSWQLPNWFEAFVLHQAILRVGAVSNPIIPIYRQRELAFILAEAHSRVFVMPQAFRNFSYVDMLADIRPSLPELEHVVLCRATAKGTAADVVHFDDLSSGTRRPPAVARGADDPVVLMFTSGTTARPKGAVHTHNTINYENRSIIDVFELMSADTVFMPSPVSHITGLLYGLCLPAMLHSAVVLQDVWAPGDALRLVEQHRCTFTVAATPFLHGLTFHPELASFDVSSLRVFACGGADVPPGLIRTARDQLGVTASRIYGSTEFPTLSTTGPHDPPDKAATTDGRAIGAAAYRILDEQDRDVVPGQVGELVARGPEQFLGYLRAEDNVGTVVDGWFRTGDLAMRDDDDFLTIRGRKKDIILRGGENISVTEVESLLFDHPGVAEIAIVAMPDAIMVERACAYVVPRAGAELTLADLGAYLDARGMAKQKIPERLELVHELPKTQSGKVQKFRLREEILGVLEREAAVKADNGARN